jgi:hypothetical protein
MKMTLNGGDAAVGHGRRTPRGRTIMITIKIKTPMVTLNPEMTIRRMTTTGRRENEGGVAKAWTKSLNVPTMAVGRAIQGLNICELAPVLP